MLAQAVLKNSSPWLFLGEEKKDTIRFIGVAFEDDPKEADKLIYDVNGEEYLIPTENSWNKGFLIRSVVRMDRVQKIIHRPNKTRRLSEMRLSDIGSAMMIARLLDPVREWFMPTAGYEVIIIQ